MADTTQISATQLRERIVTKENSAVEIVAQSLAAIDAQDTTINAFVTVLHEDALQQARAIDTQISQGEAVGPLAGVPVAVKDNICVKDIAATCGSKMLENYIAPYDATVVTALRNAGAVIIGKTNMDEFAMGSSSETSAAGPVRNPHNKDCVAGGSSGGSAAAVAAGYVPLALGSDTGGSIRQPASFCGVVGCKPTYGRISRYGLIAYASSLDQIGPFGRTVADAALLLEVLAGHDQRDTTSANIPVPQYGTLQNNNDTVKGMTFGVPTEYVTAAVAPSVREAIERTADMLVQAGAQRVEVSLPHTSYAVAAYYLIASAEASSNLARYDGVKFGFRTPEAGDLEDMYLQTRSQGFGDEVRRRIMLGTYALSSGYYDAYYLKALKVRTLIRNDFDKAFAQCDMLLTPVAPTTAFGIGEKVDDPIKMYLSDIATIPCNLAGIPGVALPTGFDTSGLPTGVQLLGAPFSEHTLMQYAAWIEQEQGLL